MSETDIMRERGILLEGEEILPSLHLTKLWADVFWRRRRGHESREDPEIARIVSLKPINILEIGVAYGRVARKLMNQLDTMEHRYRITGIDLCQYFDHYFDVYVQGYPLKFVVGDIFEMEDDGFDLIYLPMNTLPSLSFPLIIKLFKHIRSLLEPGGHFVFSNYKIRNVDKVLDLTDEVNGELLPGTVDRLAVEHTTLSVTEKSYGAEAVSTMAITRLGKSFEVIERGVFRYYKQYITQASMIQLLEEQDFEVDIDSSSHSDVYVCRISII